MRAIAWVMEVDRGSGWTVQSIHLNRRMARLTALFWRSDGMTVRVRQYVRVEKSK